MTLDRATVTFMVRPGTSKHQDTKVQISTRRANGTVIARNDDVAPGEHLGASGTYGPFDLAVIDPTATPDDFLRGTTEIKIVPKTGQNRWLTNVFVKIYWDYAAPKPTQRISQSYDIFLDEKCKYTASWPNLPFRDDHGIRVDRCPAESRPGSDDGGKRARSPLRTDQSLSETQSGAIQALPS